MHSRLAALRSTWIIAFMGVAFPLEAQSAGGNQSHTMGWAILIFLVIFSASAAAGFTLAQALRDHGKHIKIIILAIFGFIVCGAAIFTMAFTLNMGLGIPTVIVGFVCGILIKFGSSYSGLGNPPTTFGSSRWATADDVAEAGSVGTDGIRIGQFLNGNGEQEWVSYKGDRHLLTVAPTRAGKGTTQIVPNLLTYAGSALVIDPKGENAAITAEHRYNMGQEIHIVDPWSITPLEGLQSSAFNPLDWLDTSDPDMPENAMLLASALVVETNSKDPFWDEEAKALLQGLIMYVATDPEEDGRRHLPRVRELLLQSTKDLNAMFAKMALSFHPIVRSTGERSLQKEEKMFASVIASAQSHTHFLDSDRIAMNMKTSSFKFEHLKTKPMTIYLVLPSDRLNTFGRWLRLMVQQAITVNARNIATKPEKPILFLLDEFAALGRLTMVEQAYGLMAGYGMQLWGIVQDLNQLERIYDKGWQSFVSNAGMINYFGSSDKMTAEYFSSLCGDTTVWNFSSAVSRVFQHTKSDGNSTTYSDTTAASQRKLMYPDELMRLPKDMQLVFVENMHPLRATKTPWFLDPELNSLGRNLHS
ncbi:MAG: type IV secretory system conjugative DNA transfer family protein [Alphaproteobacteria bacterium]|nr:type IV secretory system conjugative DNA transfer family protein [Alphaproteobacteria bacterium]